MKKGLVFMVIATLFAGCATMSAGDKQQQRNEIDAMAREAIAALVKKDPKIQTEIDHSLAYAVADMKITKVPIVGAGVGKGVLFIKEGKQRIYFKVRRFDVGGGWGVRAYKALMVIQSPEVLKKWRTGKWIFEAGAEASAGSAAAEASSSGVSDKGFTLHLLAEGGASATATARIIHVKVDRQLTSAQ